MTTATEPTLLNISTLRCAAGTDVGMRREENQDSFGVVRHEAFQAFLVADGMGGVKGGAIASRLAISNFEENLPLLGASISPEGITRIVTGINSAIFDQGNAQPGLAGMGTTIVGLVFTPQGLLSVNVGDSRAYRIRAGAILQLTEDHTLVRELVRSGAISNDQASQHPVSHMLTRSLGPLAEVVVECRREREMPQEGDIYVLCSDGLYNFVSDSEILEVVRQNPIDDANQILINLANRRGGADNITVIVVSVGEVGGRRRGSEYRKARAGGGVDASSDTATPSTVEAADAGTVVAGEEVIIPPRVEEPKDYHAERESLKERKKTIPQHAPRVPVTLLLFGAVLFGLVVGDVARRWGAFPDFAAFLDSGVPSFLSARGGENSVTRLDDVSKELSLSRSRDGSHEGLPDIARRVSGESSGGGGRGARRDLMALNRSALQSAAAKIETHLKTLAAPPSATSDETLKQAQAALAAQNQELSQIETQIDAASRKLSLWFGRKKKAEESQQDIFVLSGEVERVGAVSERVKRKAAEWTEANYRLQAKQDEFELYPNNDGLRREVEALKRTLGQIQEDLRDEIVRAIDGVLADTYRQLEELKARRDILAAQVSTAQEEVEFLQTVASPDIGAREALRQKLERELKDIRDAISE